MLCSLIASKKRLKWLDFTIRVRDFKSLQPLEISRARISMINQLSICLLSLAYWELVILEDTAAKAFLERDDNS